MKALMIIAIFLFLGLFFIISNNNLNLSNSEDRAQLGNTYYIWAESLFDQGVEITSFVIRNEWLPNQNSNEG